MADRAAHSPQPRATRADRRPRAGGAAVSGGPAPVTAALLLLLCAEGALAQDWKAWTSCPAAGPSWLVGPALPALGGACNCTWVVGSLGAATSLTNVKVTGEPVSTSVHIYGEPFRRHCTLPCARSLRALSSWVRAARPCRWVNRPTVGVGPSPGRLRAQLKDACPVRGPADKCHRHLHSAVVRQCVDRHPGRPCPGSRGRTWVAEWAGMGARRCRLRKEGRVPGVRGAACTVLTQSPPRWTYQVGCGPCPCIRTLQLTQP